MEIKDQINRIPHASIRQLFNDLPEEFNPPMGIESFELTMSRGCNLNFGTNAVPSNPLENIDWDGTIKVSIIINLAKALGD